MVLGFGAGVEPGIEKSAVLIDDQVNGHEYCGNDQKGCREGNRGTMALH